MLVYAHSARRRTIHIGDHSLRLLYTDNDAPSFRECRQRDGDHISSFLSPASSDSSLSSLSSLSSSSSSASSSSSPSGTSTSFRGASGSTPSSFDMSLYTLLTKAEGSAISYPDSISAVWK